MSKQTWNILDIHDINTITIIVTVEFSSCTSDFVVGIRIGLRSVKKRRQQRESYPGPLTHKAAS